MCLLPKWYQYNHDEPERYPFPGSAEDGWDMTRFDPAFFRRFEDEVAALQDMGIEADLILFTLTTGGDSPTSVPKPTTG